MNGSQLCILEASAFLSGLQIFQTSSLHTGSTSNCSILGHPFSGLFPYSSPRNIGPGQGRLNSGFQETTSFFSAEHIGGGDTNITVTLAIQLHADTSVSTGVGRELQIRVKSGTHSPLLRRGSKKSFPRGDRSWEHSGE